MSKVAIWMPVYNEARHLRAAIESVLNQTFVWFTLYISDNYSTDESLGIIQDYAMKDNRIVYSKPPAHLPGIEHMQYMWSEMSYGDLLPDHDYSIHLGGHDRWEPNHLEVLIARMASERKARNPVGQEVAIVYCDTWQIDDADQVVGRYQDIIQLVQVPRPMIPQVVAASVNSPHLFGLWNEEVRRQIPIRHCCSGWDHLIVAEAALHGAVLFESACHLLMRSPKPTDLTLPSYGERHLSDTMRALGPRDFLNQLEWCVHNVDEALSFQPAGRMDKKLLTASIVATYLSLRGLNLHIVPGALAAFQQLPQVQQILGAIEHIDAQVHQLLYQDQRDERLDDEELEPESQNDAPRIVLPN